MNVSLRPLEDRDLDTIYQQVTDPESIRMAAFTAEDQTDRRAFLNRMSRLRADTSVSHRVIDVDGAIAGTIGSFRIDNQLEVTYWLDRTQWGILRLDWGANWQGFRRAIPMHASL